MVIYNKRGIGFFVESGAKEKIFSIQRNTFINEELPLIIKKMEILGIDKSFITKFLK